MIKNFKLFENESRKLRIGTSLFDDDSDGIEISVIDEWFPDSTYEFIYQKDDYKIMLFNEYEIYIVDIDYVSQFSNHVKYDYEEFRIKNNIDKYLNKTKNLAELTLICDSLVGKTYQDLKNIDIFRNYFKEKNIKKFNI